MRGARRVLDQGVCVPVELIEDARPINGGTARRHGDDAERILSFAVQPERHGIFVGAVGGQPVVPLAVRRAAYQHGVVVASEAAENLREVAGRHVAVGIEDGKIFIPRREIEPANRVANATELAAFRLVHQDVDTGELTRNRSSAVCRSVVDNVDMPRRDASVDYTLDATTNEERFVERRNHDTKLVECRRSEVPGCHTR
jgi:hypothetical protein